MIAFKKYSYWSTRFQTLSFCTGEGHYLLPDLVLPQNQTITQKARAVPNPNRSILLVQSSSGVSLKGRHLGHVEMKVPSWYSSLDILERVTTNVFSLPALILPSICTQVFIYSFSKHMKRDGVFALLAPTKVERWTRLNLWPWEIYLLIEEQEKTNEKWSQYREMINTGAVRTHRRGL